MMMTTIQEAVRDGEAISNGCDNDAENESSWKLLHDSREICVNPCRLYLFRARNDELEVTNLSNFSHDLCKRESKNKNSHKRKKSKAKSDKLIKGTPIRASGRRTQLGRDGRARTWTARTRTTAAARARTRTTHCKKS